MELGYPDGKMTSVFISSVIGGMESMREAAEAACSALDIEVVRSEDFVASPSSPRAACLSGVAKADGMILLMGERYGSIQLSGMSATEEEFEEAVRLGKHVFVFVTSNTREDRQQAFLEAVGRWDGGRTFKDCLGQVELQKEVTRSLLHWKSSPEAPELDERVQSALGQVVPEIRRGQFVQCGPWLALSWVPVQPVRMREEFFFEELPRILGDLLVTGPYRLLDQRADIKTSGNGLEISTGAAVGKTLLAARFGLGGSLAIGAEIPADEKGLSNSPTDALFFLKPSDAAFMLGRLFEFTRAVLDRTDRDCSAPTGRMQCALALLGMRHFADPFREGGGIPMKTNAPESEPPILVPEKPEAVVRSRLVAKGELVETYIKRLERSSRG